MLQPTRGVVYDMSSFLQQAVDKYRQLAGPEFQHLKKVSTPFHNDKIARPVDTEAEMQACSYRQSCSYEAPVCRQDGSL